MSLERDVITTEGQTTLDVQKKNLLRARATLLLKDSCACARMRIFFCESDPTAERATNG